MPSRSQNSLLEMHNTRLTIAYDGTSYGGWQIQKNSNTIQEEIEKALKKILKEKIRVIAAGRTDAGVHAKAQTVNFKSKRILKNNNMFNALNANLPKDIAILKVKNAHFDFHSRFDAKSKIYRYTIYTGDIDDPFTIRYYYRALHELNISLMRNEAKALLGKHDFKSFQRRSELKNTVRRIKKINIQRKANNFIYIDIEADGFLYNMVRNIVGTLIDIGRGYFPKGSMRKILSSRDRKKAGPTAPAKGLVLLKVLY